MVRKTINIHRESFDCFDVYRLDGCHSFIHVSIADNRAFYQGLFNYYFNDDSLVRYCENNKALHFTPTAANYAMLYKHLSIYIDDHNADNYATASDLDSEICPILAEEGLIEGENGNLKIRLDKIGKIGEYIFCCLLYDFFHFDCIIPKVHLLTDRNMNVYGIDTLFYSETDNLLLFGEAKYCTKLSNGISLINHSLKHYEQQLRDEFLLVLSNRLYKTKLNKFENIYGPRADVCISFEQFVKDANISRIGVPVFIAHGSESDVHEIMRKLDGVNKMSLFGLDTIYIIISLPVVNKQKSVSVLTQLLIDKRKLYEQRATNASGSA